MKRKTEIDLLRIISSFAVVLLHTAAMGEVSSAEKGFYISTVINSLTRFSVPVFVMISGSFLLERNDSLLCYIKKASSLIVTMLLWSSLYLIRYSLSGAVGVESIGGVITYLFTEPMHLWYFYALAVLILFTPVMREFVKNANKQTYLYVLSVMFVFGCIITPFISLNVSETASRVVNKMKIGTQLAFPFYYMFGYFVKKFGIKRTYCIWSVAVGIITTVTLVLISSFFKGSLDESFLSFYAPNTAIFAVGIFSLFYGLNLKENRFVKLVAPLTGGVYGLHFMILPTVYKGLLFLPSFLRIMSASLLTFIISCVAVYIFKKVKRI